MSKSKPICYISSDQLAILNARGYSEGECVRAWHATGRPAKADTPLFTIDFTSAYHDLQTENDGLAVSLQQSKDEIASLQTTIEQLERRLSPPSRR